MSPVRSEKDTLLSWYAVILCEWTEENGLNYIMRAAQNIIMRSPKISGPTIIYMVFITTMQPVKVFL